MASIILTPRAQRNLERLIQTHALPDTTSERVQRAIEPLGRFPRLGESLPGQWQPYRFILGPWRWMIIVYEYLEASDKVAIVTVQDGRSSRSPTAAR